MTRISFVLAATAILGLGANSTAARAKPAVKAGAPAVACGLKSLPFTPGNTWTYRSGSQQVVIKVLSVEPGKDYAGKPATSITLEEVASGRTLKTALSCTPTGGLQVPLDSFFFSGEPGGAVGSTTTITSRDKATLLPDEQIIAENGWVEVVKADVERTDTGGAGTKHLPAKVEVERHVTVKDGEILTLGLGKFTAQKVQFELRGRGIIEEEKTEIPIKRPAVAYLVKGVGFVKIDDAFDRTWELVETNLVGAAPPPK